MLAVSLYHHAVETEQSRYTLAQAARILITAHTFATPGICHPQKKLFFNGGPWLAGKVFFLEGDSLFQTLMLNLLRYAPGHPRPNLCQTENDAPAWEKDNPFVPERTFPQGYLDYLTWQNRRVLLLPVEEEGKLWVKEVVEAPGLKLEGDIRDPMKVLVLKNEKDGYKMLYLNEAKALWRECPAICDVKHPERVYVPAALDWVAQIIYKNDLSTSLTFRLMSVGLVVENNSKIVLHRMERIPLPLRYLEDPDLFEKLRAEVQKAEETRNKVYSAINTLAKFILSFQADFPNGRDPQLADIHLLMSHWNWEAVFWPSLEVPFYSLIQDLALDNPDAVQTWHSVLVHAAWDTLENTIRMSGGSLAAIKASVQARGALGGGLNKLELIPAKEQENLGNK
jgi:CRISPR system Cascade subunit CasA